MSVRKVGESAVSLSPFIFCPRKSDTRGIDHNVRWKFYIDQISRIPPSWVNSEYKIIFNRSFSIFPTGFLTNLGHHPTFQKNEILRTPMEASNRINGSRRRRYYFTLYLYLLLKNGYCI